MAPTGFEPATPGFLSDYLKGNTERILVLLLRVQYSNLTELRSHN